MPILEPSSRQKAEDLVAKIPDYQIKQLALRSLNGTASIREMVRVFHRMYELPIVHPTNAREDFSHITKQRLAMRFGLIVEEFMELCEAMDIRADINFLYLNEEGEYQKALSVGEKQATESLRTVPGHIRYYYDEEWDRHTFELDHDKIDDEDLHKIVRERMEVAVLETDERNMSEIADASFDLKYVIEGFELEVGIDSQATANEGQASNLSKLMPDGSVKRRSDGKVLKGPNYFKPNMRKALAAVGMRFGRAFRGAGTSR